MIEAQSLPGQRLQQLLADRATEGLDRSDWPELDRLIDQQTELGWDDLDLAAAAIGLCFEHADPVQPPEELVAAVRAHARVHFSAPRAQVGSTESDPGARSSPWMGRLAYAAAVFVVISLVASAITRFERGQETAPAVAREILMADAPEALRLDFRPLVDDPYGAVRGDVVWSVRHQRGFLRLSGMPANETSRTHYQLWIVDPTRDVEPVDGGVFDVPTASGEVVIAIDAKLPVLDPRAFVITAEHRGGVVVSDGPHLIVAARS